MRVKELAADLKVDPDPSLRSPVKCLDRPFVHQGVQHESQVSISMLLLLLDLTINTPQDLVAHQAGRHQQFVVAVLPRVAGQGGNRSRDPAAPTSLRGGHGSACIDRSASRRFLGVTCPHCSPASSSARNL